MNNNKGFNIELINGPSFDGSGKFRLGFFYVLKIKFHMEGDLNKIAVYLSDFHM